MAGVYAAGDAQRGPATVVEGIADAAAFAEAVIGEAHTYDIPEQAYVTKADAEAKKGILAMSGCVCCEGERCLQCATVCENCVDSCPNRANVVIRMADGSHQIVHVDKMCNECGNCTQFCPLRLRAVPRQVHPVPDRRGYGGLSQRRCVCSWAAARCASAPSASPRTTISDGKNDLPADLEKLIVTIRDKVRLSLQLSRNAKKETPGCLFVSSRQQGCGRCRIRGR